jgi:hypothetical protein
MPKESNAGVRRRQSYAKDDDNHMPLSMSRKAKAFDIAWLKPSV